MSADTAAPVPLTKVDSAIADGDASPIQKKIQARRTSSAVEEGDAPLEKKKISHRRTSSTVSGVFNINDLGELHNNDKSLSLADSRHRKGRSGISHCPGDAKAELVSHLQSYSDNLCHERFTAITSCSESGLRLMPA